MRWGKWSIWVEARWSSRKDISIMSRSEFTKFNVEKNIRTMGEESVLSWIDDKSRRWTDLEEGSSHIWCQSTKVIVYIWSNCGERCVIKRIDILEPTIQMVDIPCIIRETVRNLVIASLFWRTILGIHNMADIPRILRETFRQEYWKLSRNVSYEAWLNGANRIKFD